MRHQIQISQSSSFLAKILLRIQSIFYPLGFLLAIFLRGVAADPIGVRVCLPDKGQGLPARQGLALGPTGVRVCLANRTASAPRINVVPVNEKLFRRVLPGKPVESQGQSIILFSYYLELKEDYIVILLKNLTQFIDLYNRTRL